MEPMSIRPDIRLIFAAALEQLTNEKRFQKITVNDITSACNAHRSTFYRYFSDKMDLAEWYFRYLADLEAEELLKNGHKLSDPYFSARAFLAILRMMHSKKQFFQKLAQYEGQNSFDKIYYQWNMDRIMEHIQRTNPGIEVPQNIKYALTFYYFGETKLIQEWARNGMRETPEKMLEIALENIPTLLQSYVNINFGSPSQQSCEKNKHDKKEKTK